MERMDSMTDQPSGYPYSNGESWARNSYLFTHEKETNLDISNTQEKPTIRVVNQILEVSKFRIQKYQMNYINPFPFEIDLRTIQTGKYRIIAVHNFRAEDINPNLSEGICGIFLSGQKNDIKWDEPEDLPFECRNIEIFGIIDTKEAEIWSL
jgi:hypothetical protein